MCKVKLVKMCFFSRQFCILRPSKIDVFWLLLPFSQVDNLKKIWKTMDRIPRLAYAAADTSRSLVDGKGFVESSESFKYLGSIIYYSHSSNSDISKRIKSATAAFGALKNLFGDKYLSEKVKALGLMQTSLRSRLSRMPHERHIKEEREERELETSLSTAAVIKLGTRPSPPPRPMTYTTREPTPTHTNHTTRNTQEQNKIHFASCKRTLSPARHVMEDTSHQTRSKIDSSNLYLLMRSKN
jgi:hypothetical protein